MDDLGFYSRVPPPPGRAGRPQAVREAHLSRRRCFSLQPLIQLLVELNHHLSITGRALRNWAIAQLADSFAVGVLWFVGLRILGVPLSYLWAPVAGVLEAVPHLGPILGLIGPFLTAGVASRDWRHPLGVLILYAVIAAIDGFLLQPSIMRRAARVPIWASIVAPIVLGFLWPFWGVFLAAPLLAVLCAYKAHWARWRGPGEVSTKLSI